MTFRKLLSANVFAGVILCAALQAALPQSFNAEEFAKTIPEDIRKQIARRGKDDFIRRSVQQIFQVSPDGVLTREAMELSISHQTAQKRANFIAGILRYDLNGDLEVSLSEAEQQRPLMRQNARAQVALYFYEHDADKDGSITIAEMSAAADASSQRGVNTAIKQLLKFDANADGEVGLQELMAIVSALPEGGVTEGQSKPRFRVNPNCEAPEVTTGQKVVFLSGHEGRALSTVALNGQSTKTTSTVVKIEEGEAPLYLVLASYSPIVWKIEGATDRIKTVLIQKPSTPLTGPGVAIVGLSRNIVHFTQPKSCLSQVPTRTGAELNAAMDQLSLALKTRVSHAVASYYLQDVPLPSGIISKARSEASPHPYSKPQTFTLGEVRFELSAQGMAIVPDEEGQNAEPIEDGYSIRDMVRSFPAGIFDFKPEDLVASGEVESYEVLPSSAGVLQLMAQGQVEPIGRGRYRIIAPVTRFPGSLDGSYSIRFYLAEDLPLPKGSLGRSSVFSEKDGTCLSGPDCK